MGLDEAPEQLPEGAAGSLALPEVEIKNPDVPLPTLPTLPKPAEEDEKKTQGKPVTVKEDE